MRFLAMLDADEYSRLTLDLEMGRYQNPLRFRTLDGIPLRIDLGNPAGYHTRVPAREWRPGLAGALSVSGKFEVTREPDAS